MRDSIKQVMKYTEPRMTLKHPVFACFQLLDARRRIKKNAKNLLKPEDSLELNYLSNFFKGIIIGVGNIAPGASGGALAMILGIYEKMIYSVGNFFEDIKKNSVFLIPIGLGAAIGILGFSNILKFLLDTVPMPTTYAFAGMIVGTLPVLFRRANKQGFKKVWLIPFVITLLIALVLAFIETGLNNSIQYVGGEGTNSITILKLIACGFLIAGSIVIPGISGSVLLMLIGVYGSVLEAISSLDMSVLFPMAIGVGIGVQLFSKLMVYLLREYYGVTYYAILGFVIGAVPKVITGYSIDLTGLISMLCFIIGLVLSLYLCMLEKN